MTKNNNLTHAISLYGSNRMQISRQISIVAKILFCYEKDFFELNLKLLPSFNEGKCTVLVIVEVLPVIKALRICFYLNDSSKAEIIEE